VPQDPPKWLARDMQDPWIGDEARELWQGAQQAQREAAAFREVLGSPEDARALKEIYPGGVAEARNAAASARELAEIDAAIFGVPGRGAEELRVGRAQLVEKLHAQDPSALRELVRMAARLLEGSGSQDALPPGAREVTSNSTLSLSSGRDNLLPAAGAQDQQAKAPIAPEVAMRYREFERAANADLEKSVGGAIRQAMDLALPNLKLAEKSIHSGEGTGREGQHLPLQDRLHTAVREEVEAALRADAALGEQVARILGGRRFDEAARAQVVRLIDSRARQLVPGAVKRIVNGWTAATLGSGKSDTPGAERKSLGAPRSAHSSPAKSTNERPAGESTGRKLPRGRVDYRKWSDDQILDM